MNAGRRTWKRRDEFLASDTNLVEIDLVRAGDWITMMGEALVLRAHHTTYLVSVRRSVPDSKGELYPVGLADRLPTTAVPLRSDDPDVLVDLQALATRAHVNGRYDRIDCARPSDPLLTGDEAAWADRMLRAGGGRARACAARSPRCYDPTGAP